MDESTALQRLIAEPKGKTKYTPGQVFLLHVFWEAPHLKAAETLLSALAQCAAATHRDTPCVPTYFFRLSCNDVDLYGDAPVVVKDHKQLSAAIKKLSVGIPKHAVEAECLKRHLNPNYLDLDMDAPLPEPLQHQKPVAVEFTEVYLDERAFMEHAGSKDYLKGYGTVMSPGLSNGVPVTIRLGEPNQSMIEKILEPILKESVAPLQSGYSVWNPPSAVTRTGLLCMDVETVPTLSIALQSAFVWCVCFQHPFKRGIFRWMAAFPDIPSLDVLQQVHSFQPLKAELATLFKEEWTSLLQQLDWNIPIIEHSVGYIVHEKASELVAE